MMTKRSIVILLFVSLAFNLAVLGSILWIHYGRACPQRVPHVREHMTKLPPHLQDAHAMWNPEIRELHSSFNESKIELMRELAKNPINEENINAIIDSSMEVQGSLERALAHRLLEIRKQMSAAEAEDYFSSRAENMQERIQAFRHKSNRRKTDEKDNRN
ncbi:MAG: periplasmic heavy metal sensor [Candidatus Cloacimonadaceae bacterium]|jgi:hypothetical protein|nr:periplasmic heavy metal sensor [Candidatus Cloacimonadaceae bacterium]